MELLTVGCRLLLAVVLGLAGFAKLADLAGSRRAMEEFGVPATLAAPLGALLPVAEITVAAMLLWARSAWWGAVAALALFAMFSAAINLNLARGRKPDCHCFGQWISAPIGRATLIRNGVFALAAAWLVWQGPARAASIGVPGLAGAPVVMWLALAVGVAALVVAAVDGWLLAQLLQQNGRLLLRIENLEARLGDGGGMPAPMQEAHRLSAGSPAPAFSLPGLHGETLTLEALTAGRKPLLLVFLSSQCSPCNALLPEIAGWQRAHASSLTVVPIMRGKPDKAVDSGLQTVLVQNDAEVSQAYHVATTPSAVLVRPDGTIGSPRAGGANAIRRLVKSIVDPPVAGDHANGHAKGDCHCAENATERNSHHAAPEGAARRGDTAPAFRLPDLDGNWRDLASFQGRPALILFWNPGCGYCRRMLDDLRAWEADPPKGAPGLLLISTGTPDANRSQSLQSPILLDPEFAVARAYGALGTPSAVLLDVDGRIASDVAAGADAVLALARAPGLKRLDTAG